jgi:hypothetical protein
VLGVPGLIGSTLAELGDIGEIVGGLVVVVSRVDLAIQLRQKPLWSVPPPTSRSWRRLPPPMPCSPRTSSGRAIEWCGAA